MPKSRAVFCAFWLFIVLAFIASTTDATKHDKRTRQPKVSRTPKLKPTKAPANQARALRVPVAGTPRVTATPTATPTTTPTGTPTDMPTATHIVYATPTELPTATPTLAPSPTWLRTKRKFGSDVDVLRYKSAVNDAADAPLVPDVAETPAPVPYSGDHAADPDVVRYNALPADEELVAAPVEDSPPEPTAVPAPVRTRKPTITKESKEEVVHYKAPPPDDGDYVAVPIISVETPCVAPLP